MNEGNTGVPGDKGIRGGAYWRIVSKDEIAFLDYAYGFKINFVEVAANAAADIVLITHNEGGSPGSNLGAGGPDSSILRIPGDATQGRITTAGSVSLNAVPGFHRPLRRLGGNQ